MTQTRDEITQNLTERMCWEGARRDDTRMARRLYRKQVVDGVYRLDEGALLEDLFHFLRAIGVMELLEEAHGAAIQRAMGVKGCSPVQTGARYVATTAGGTCHSDNGPRYVSPPVCTKARVSKAPMLPSPTSTSPRCSTPARTRAMAGIYRGSSARCPGTTSVATGRPRGSRAESITLTCGKSGRWSWLCPNGHSPSSVTLQEPLAVVLSRRTRGGGTS
jgi:hypothetical protein